jgi:leader peptidase (prepilin peptidase) / N-methyltransferase
MMFLTAGSAVLAGSAATFVPRIACRLAVPFGSPARSACADCSRPFPSGRTGWVRPGAACRCAPAPWRVVLGASAAAGLTGWFVGPQPILAVLLPVVVVGTLLAEIDLRCLRLPDPMVATLAAAIVPPLTVIAMIHGEWAAVGRAFLAAGSVGLIHLVMAVLPGGGLGLGDVKLAAVLGFLLGWVSWPTVLLGLAAPHVISGPVVLFLLLRRRIGRRTALPFGPALLVGALVAVTITSA